MNQHRLTTHILLVTALIALLIIAGCSQTPSPTSDSEASGVGMPAANNPSSGLSSSGSPSAGSTVAGSGSAASTVKIGWIGPLTGPGALYGVIHLNAATLAVEDINKAGGINGKPIELLVEDGKCEGATAATAATKLIEVDGVTHIVGGHCSTESLSIIPVTEAHKVFLVAGSTGTNAFTGAGRFAFRTYAPARVIYGKLADFAYEKGSRKIVTFAEQKDWPQSVAESFAKTFTSKGGKVLSMETYAPGTSDFRTQLLKIKQLNPDAILLTVQGPDSAAEIVKEMAELGMHTQLYGDAVAISKGTYDKTNGKLPPTAFGGTVHINPNRSPATKAYLERYIARFGEIGVDPFAATGGYDEIRITAKLIQSCGSDPECKRTTILSKPFEEVTGTFRFREDGDPNPFIGIVRIVNGTQVYEYEGE